MPYKAKGKCVYKKDTGKKVGCTKGDVKKYLAALHANVKDSVEENIGEVRKIVRKNIVELYRLSELGGIFLHLNEDYFLSNFNKINDVITKEQPEEIRDLLLNMFPNAKEIINYQYNDEAGQPFSEWRRVIFEIDNYILVGPKTIDSDKIKLDQETISDRQEKYNQYIKDKDSGKPAMYFRNNNSDPRTIDFTKLPPVTLLSKGNYFEPIDGAHRIFLAKMSNKPLRAYIWKKSKNTHPNVEKIKNLFNKQQ